MDSIFIYRELKTEFSKYINESTRFSEIQVQKACWKFGIYPSTSQIYEIRSCQHDDDNINGIEFYEFCLLIATIKYSLSHEKHSFKIKSQSHALRSSKNRWDVFLGGACNPTTWRLDVAIPFLKEKNITFYNPQVSQWDPSLIEIEEFAKESAKVLLFVLDLKRTRGIASLVEAAFLSGQGRNLVLVIPSERPKTIKDVNVKELDENEFQSINRSYLFIADLVQRQGIPLFTNVYDALKATRICLISKSIIQDLTDIDGVVPVKHSFVNVSRTVRTLQKIFQSLDTTQCGEISQNAVKDGIKMLFKKEVPLISQETKSFKFSDFCIEYSILLLSTIWNRREQPRSQSVVNFKLRCNSLDNLEKLDQEIILNSAINMKQQVDLVCVSEENENKSVKMTLLCNCFNANNKLDQQYLAYYLARLWKCPFRRSTIQPLQPLQEGQINETLEIKPELLVSEEKYDIYLGGTCGNSNWREKIAIPLLQKAGCSFYNPKMSNVEWSRKLLPVEAEARKQSKILVYVITNECTSTATLVEVGHFIGQGRKIILFVQMLTYMSSPPCTPMSQLLQSSCSFPATGDHSFFSSLKATESSTTGYQSNYDTSTSQFSLPPISNKLSISDAGNLRNSHDYSELAVSINNISKINSLSHEACMDHNRGRKYLLDLAHRAKVPIFSTIEETISHAILWCQRLSPSHGWTNKNSSTHL